MRVQDKYVRKKVSKTEELPRQNNVEDGKTLLVLKNVSREKTSQEIRKGDIVEMMQYIERRTGETVGDLSETESRTISSACEGGRNIPGENGRVCENLQEVLGTNKAKLGKAAGEGMEMDTEGDQKYQGRLGLKVLEHNMIREMRVDQSQPSLRIEGKWKRVGRKIKGSKRAVGEENKENEEMKGSKRFQLIDEEDQEEMSKLQSKRARTDCDQTVTNIAKVGVASLEWPQMLQ